MHQNKLICLLDDKRIKEAIAVAERHTSGEIYVSVSPFFWGNVHRVAKKAFARLGLRGTREHNGVLFFVVPARKKFVVLGDAGIHDKVGQEFWHAVTAAVGEKFRAGEYTEGLLRGIELAGEQLALHFPRSKEAGSEKSEG